MIDKRLEELSDKVRFGIPVSLLDALDVIDYQERIKKEHIDRPPQWWRIIWHRLMVLLFSKRWSRKP